ncbi:MAG: hypothetical protein ACI90R_002328, partial [Alteromonas macleodii]
LLLNTKAARGLLIMREKRVSLLLYFSKRFKCSSP